MKSLRAKLVLALLFTSLLVVVIIAVLTPIMVEHEFVEDAREVHYARFARAIERYIEQHQSWGTEQDALRYALTEQRFRSERRRRLADPDFRPPPGNRPYMEAPPPLPPDAALGGINPEFEFVLTDTEGHILHGGKEYQPGQQLSREQLDDADPIRVNGEIVAYALPSGTPALTPADEAYLHTLQETLFFSALMAILVIIPLGIWQGSRLVSALNRLTRAVNLMAKGDLQQQVDVRTKDEIGELAAAFNSMNTQLVEAYRSLEESRDMVAQQAEKLRELSIRDELTGLYNRRFFNEEVQVLHASALRYGHGFCLVLGDIDHFKLINDNFSHAIGDEVLKQVAQILDTGIRNSDIIARYGGEEMVLALPNTAPNAAVEMMERLRKGIESYPWQNIADGLKVTMSFGICDHPEGDNFEQMLALADEQLYKAKNSGRNKVCSLSLD